MAHSVEGGAREFLSVAVRISLASNGKDGFSVQLFPDLRPPQTIYVTPQQMDKLVGLAEADATEGEIWAELAKVPMEPLLPARSLYPRLRQLLIDQKQALREEMGALMRRVEARMKPPEPPKADDAPVQLAPDSSPYEFDPKALLDDPK